MSIKIAIADDHPIVIEGISNLLHAEKNFEVIAQYRSGGDLLKGLQKQQPDVLLLDIQFPDTTGNELVRLITPRYPQMRILVLTSVDNVFDVTDMMQNGCAGYMLKNTDLPVLVDAIEKVYAGGEFLEPSLKEQLLKAMLQPQKKKNAAEQLTLREQKILDMIAKGQTNRDIAQKLCLSYRTIQNNRLTLYQKFGVHNTAELIKEALQQGAIK